MVDGTATGEMRLALDATRTMVVKPGTPGEITCAKLAEINQCIVAADLLGDAVVWFAYPKGTSRRWTSLGFVTNASENRISSRSCRLRRILTS